MGKILVVVLGLAVVLGAAYYYTTHSVGPGGSKGETPPERLKNVKSAAQRIEQDAQRRADELFKPTE